MRTGVEKAKEYLRKHQLCAPRVARAPHARLGLVVVAPCHDEPDALATLASLARCRRPDGAVEVLLVVNASERDAEAVRARNRATVRAAREFAAAHGSPELRFHVVDYPRLPARHAGVGLARKLGMDEAVGRLARAGAARGVIASLDADCLVDADYLGAIEEHFHAAPRARACTVYFEHPLEGPLATEVYAAMARYELYLRYYRRALRRAGFPHAHHTLGSCMAVRAEAYAAQGGMNRRKAGEDFYFLNKLAVAGGVSELNRTRVVPAARVRARTPFGTAAALGAQIGSGRGGLLAHAPAVFRDLGTLLERVDALYEDGPRASAFRAGLPGTVASFLAAAHFERRHAEMRANTASRESYRKRFFGWLDAFRALKFAQHATRVAHPRVPVEHACAALLAAEGLLGPGARDAPARELLALMRSLDRQAGAAPPAEAPGERLDRIPAHARLSAVPQHGARE